MSERVSSCHRPTAVALRRGRRERGGGGVVGGEGQRGGIERECKGRAGGQTLSEERRAWGKHLGGS